MESETAVAALGALAQPHRLALFRLLVAAGPAGQSAGACAQALALPAATLSFHLKTLRIAGLVTVRRHGRSLIYTADFALMNRLLGFLTDACCDGHPEQCVVPSWEQIA